MNNKYSVLIVEDEKNIQTFVSALLEANGYQAIIANTCYQAEMLYSSYLPDLIILDLGLPDKDGSIFLAKLRENNSVPVIVLSARTKETDKVNALDLGANDYITKPFGSAELLARVRSALRNSRHNKEGRLPSAKFIVGDLMIDYEARQIFIKNEEIKLTQTEYNIMAFLSEHSGKMMTYATIIKAIWGGYPNEGSIKKLQVNMANIRKKFGAKPGEDNYITNELGVGYRMSEKTD